MKKINPNSLNLTIQGGAGIILVFLAAFIKNNPKFILKSKIYLYTLVVAGFGILILSIISVLKKKIIIEDDKITVSHLVNKDVIAIKDIKTMEKIDLGKEKFPPFQERFKYELTTENGVFSISSEEFTNLTYFYDEVKKLMNNKK